MIRSTRVLPFFALLPLALIGCSGTDREAPSDAEGVTRELRSELPRAAHTVGAETVAVHDLSEFAWSFYKQLYRPDKNLVYSPYSIAAATAMLSAGAAGETLSQIQSALHFSGTGPALHEGQNALSAELASRNRDASENMDAQALRVSNDFWMLPELEPTHAFLDTLALHYGSGVHLAPFSTKHEESRKAINSKVSRDTGELIPELLPDGSITPDVLFVLTNALYFKSRWSDQFAKSATKPASFTLQDGSSKEVATMRQSTQGSYLSGDGFFAVSLSYLGNDLQMVFVVPDAGTFAAFASTVDAARAEEIAATMTSAYLDISLPKFQVHSVVALGDELRRAGMVKAFTGSAEFPGISDRVSIGGAFHQGRIIVDEEGTEAAAATAFAGVGVSLPSEPTIAKIDRPFLFFIRDETGAPLFVGHVVDPT